MVTLDERAKPKIAALIEGIRREQDESELAHGEAMLAYLKVLLILAARIKSQGVHACRPGTADPTHPALVQLRELIEQNYQSLHSPADYAARLHMTPKTLGRIGSSSTRSSR